MKQDAPKGFLISVKKIRDSFLKASKKRKETVGASIGDAQLRGEKKEALAHTEEPGKGKHTDKWDSCVKDVKAKSGDKVNAYAVCTANLGPSIESNRKRESTDKLTFRGRFTESTPLQQEQDGAQPSGRRFRVTLLQEGIGNLKDCFYYTPEAIASAVQIYEGKKFFINHPGAAEEQDRPERDVRDIAGYFENCSAEADANGVTCLNGDLIILNGPAFERERTLIMESLAYSLKHQDEDLVGLSINASGDFEEVGIEAFINEQQVPEPCKVKLVEALAQGITMMRAVHNIESAVSCDLVTTAGAGGSINKLLEGEKVAKQEEKKESKQEEKHEEGHKQEDGADAGHADAEQDKDLIMSMLKKHLGDGFSDEDKAMAKEAYESAKAMHQEEGMEEEDAHKAAMETAGAHMKMARYLQKKEKAGDPDSDANKAAAHKPGEQMPQEKGVADMGVKESAKTSDSDKIRLIAENAKLREENAALKLEKHVEAKLTESRLPRSATKKLREAIKNVKTTKEFDEKLAIFKEAFEAGSGEADGSLFILGAEKTEIGTSGAATGFGDCVDN